MFDLDVRRLRVYEGQGLGSLRADFTGTEPRYQAWLELKRFQLEAFMASLLTDEKSQGVLDFSASWDTRGWDRSALVRALHGEIRLHGTDLTVSGVDLDTAFDRYEASQRFSLVDVGAVLLVGPAGLVLSKGLDFARVLQGADGQSALRILVSEWTVKDGVMQARDVAIATRRHRLAMQGRIDLAGARYDTLRVALIDARGCVKVQQTIRGSFSRPVVDKPGTLKALSGPVVRLFGKVLPERCPVFYAGSVMP